MRTSPLRTAVRGARRFGLPFLTIVPAALALQAGPALADPATVTRTFTTRGCGGIAGVTDNEFVVPPGVTSMTVTLRGGVGDGSGAQRGDGAQLTGTISVNPGDTLYACVDEGGGAGGTGSGGSDGGAGGGYSALSRYSSIGDPYGIAAGGGGMGGSAGGAGGDAGLPGGDGGNGGDGGLLVGGGGGASNSGNGGVGGSADLPADSGLPGAIRIGGAGGAGLVGGGGGGSGVYGGGGGGAVGAEGTGGGGGGGGGTSYCGMGVCSSQLSEEGAAVVLSYSPAATTTTASVSNPTPNRGQQITYTATVAPNPGGGMVEFRIGNAIVWGCGAQPVDAVTGVATCATNAPNQPGTHTLTATFSGTSGFAASSGQEQLTARSGAVAISPSPTADFGSVELGEQSTRPFTVTNTGDGALEIDAVYGIFVAEHRPRAMPDPATDFRALADQCTGATLAPGDSCTVTVAFAPIELGERSGELIVFSDAYHSTDDVMLSGVGIEPRPEPRPQPEQPRPQPEQPRTQPEQPRAQPEQPRTPQPTPPVASPAPTPERPNPAPPAVGARVAASVRSGAAVTPAGGVRLPLVCPAAQPCSISGTLTLGLTGGQARTAASTTRVLARFRGLRVAAGKTKHLSLRLPASFVRAQQKKGVRKLRTTLTIRTTLGNGRSVTTRQTVTLLIPRARAAQEPGRRPSFTG